MNLSWKRVCRGECLERIGTRKLRASQPIPGSAVTEQGHLRVRWRGLESLWPVKRVDAILIKNLSCFLQSTFIVNLLWRHHAQSDLCYGSINRGSALECGRSWRLSHSEGRRLDSTGL